MTNEEITAAFTAIKQAIEQYNGKLKGWIAFFDASVSEPMPFEDVDDLSKVQPVGGGGTSFQCIFDYINNEMKERPNSLVILTDGFSDFPDEKEAHGLDTLWLLTNKERTPTFGRTAYLNI